MKSSKNKSKKSGHKRYQNIQIQASPYEKEILKKIADLEVQNSTSNENNSIGTLMYCGDDSALKSK